MNTKLVSPYKGAEKNCGDRLKVLNVQTWDMSDRHNLQIYEILSVIKSLTLKKEKERSKQNLKSVKKPPASGSSCGDDYKTKTKYKGPEKTIGDVIAVCEHQVSDMFLIDGLNADTIFNLIKDLVEIHIEEIDEFAPTNS